MKKFFNITILFFILISCNPYRANFFDTLAKYPVVSGYVRSYATGLPYKGILVQNDLGMEVSTDKFGFFKIRVPIGKTEVSFGGVFFSDTVLNVVTTDSDTLTLVVFLDALPVIDTVFARTEHITSNFLGEKRYLNLSYTVSDQDGQSDIDSTVFCVDTLTFMKADLTPFYLSEDTLPYGDIHCLQGKDMYLYVFDKEGEFFKKGPFFIVRVMDITPGIVSPIGGDTTSARPTFVWKNLDVPYSVSYYLEIYTAQQGTPSFKIYTSPTVTDTSFQMPFDIGSGYYYFVVYAEDSYGDDTRSKEALFYVR